MNKFTELIERKDLLYFMVVSNLKSGSKDLMLGYLWWILDPLLFMLVYWVLIGVILGRGGPDYPIFVLVALVPFRAFMQSLSQSVSAVATQQSIISQINFPRLFLPISNVLANHIRLIFGFVVVCIVALFFDQNLSYAFLLIPPLLVQVLLTIGLGMFLSIAGVYFRDMRNVMQIVNRLLLYGSPVLYGLERVPEAVRDVYLLNPMACLIILYRDAIMSDSPFQNYALMGVVIFEAFIFVSAGYIIFILNDRKILKIIS